jgi:hypothetical protein
MTRTAAPPHTSGPWRITKCDDGVLMCHTEGDTICFGDPNHKDPDDSANFALIAAAPELLAALRWCVVHDGECLGDHPTRLEWFRNIIALAEGRP